MIRTGITVALILLSAAVLGAPRVQVENAWIREAPPGAPVHGGFLTLRNQGSEDAVITAAQSPRFGRIEIHRTVVDGDMARMEKQAQLTIPAGGQVELAPGGYHMMLFEAASTPRKGERIPFALIFEEGSRIEFHAEVRRDHESSGEHQHQRHQH